MTYVAIAVAAVRAAFVDKLNADPQLAEVAVGLEPPRGHYATETASGLQMDTAANPAAVWLSGDIDGTMEVVALGVHQFNETWELGVIVQVLPDSDADDLRAAEAQVAGIAGRVLDLVWQDRTLGVANAVTPIVAVASGFKWIAGPFGPGSAARCELQINVQGDRC